MDAQRYAAQLREQAEQQASAAAARAAAAEHEAERFAARVAAHRLELAEAQRRLTELIARRQEETQELAQAQQRLGELTEQLIQERDRLIGLSSAADPDRTAEPEQPALDSPAGDHGQPSGPAVASAGEDQAGLEVSGSSTPRPENN